MAIDTMKISVGEIVAQVVEKCHDPEKAVKRIVDRLRNSPPEQEAWNNETARIAVAEMVHRRRHQNRDATIRASWLTPESANAAEERVVRSMLDEYTVGAKALGDCTRQDLVYASAIARNQETGLRTKRWFFDRIVAMLKDDSTKVRAVLNDEQAVKIHRDAERAAEKAVKA